MGKIPLSEWSRWLFEEVFRDETGEGRPITTLVIDDELFGRAVRRGGAENEPREARQAFLESFPSRDTIAGWLGGTRDPGPATVALLFLCCFAASEAGGSDQNDYRNRLQEILGWDAPIIGCAGLPALWNRLVRQVDARASEGHYRSIVLPDPKHRNQIGHAIELTFPSRPDTAKLRTALGHGGLDELSKPASVLRWLAPLIAKGRFSKSFSDTFSSFENSWRSGQRALSDHRFWTGWTMVVAKQQSESEVYCPFEVLSDEWGQYHLVDKNGAALELGSIVGPGSLPTVLARAIRDRRPIFLIEEGWGRYRWAGPKTGAGIHTIAALICERSYSVGFLNHLARAPVVGAPGWCFTQSAAALHRTLDQPPLDDELLDVTISGSPRVDGGRLARPSFPIIVSLSGAVDDVSVDAAMAERIRIEKIAPTQWKLQPLHPLDSTVRVQIDPTLGGEPITRLVRLRRSTIAPSFGEISNDHYVSSEQAAPSSWLPTYDVEPTATATTCDPRDELLPNSMRQELADIVEFFAARTAPMSLPAVLDLIKGTLPNPGPASWDVLRSLLEGGVLNPLRARGWRGRAVAPVAPTAAIGRRGADWYAVIDGLVHEVLAERIVGIAKSNNLLHRHISGVSPWAMQSTLIQSSNLDSLVGAVRELGLRFTFIRPDLLGLLPWSKIQPDGDGRNHTRKIESYSISLGELGGRSVHIDLRAREREDAPRLWAVGINGANDRYWHDRHIAIIDACQIADTPAIESRGRYLCPRITGINLPLQIARWIRLTTGQGSGPSENGYLYAGEPRIVTEVRRILNVLTTISTPALENTRPIRALERVAVIAKSRGRHVDIEPVWRRTRRSSRSTT